VSTSFTPSSDLNFRPELARMTAPFTTLQAGHFVKPADSAQPVAAAKADDLLSFDGSYSEMYVTQALDLDYDEPNAVVEDIEFVSVGSDVQSVQITVVTAPAVQTKTAEPSIVHLTREAA
jgi:hypothetical protein